VQSIAVRLIEIPTVNGDLLSKARESTTEEDLINDKEQAAEVLTLAQLQTNYEQFVETALGDLRLPPPATLLDYEVTTRTDSATQVKLFYLSERDIEPDARQLLRQQVQKRFENPTAAVAFERIGATPSTLSFSRNQTLLERKHTQALDLIGQELQKFSSLRAEINAGADSREHDGVAAQREQAIATYLLDKWKIAPERIELVPVMLPRREAIVRPIPAPSKDAR
jgi:hypothetical protein